MNEVLRQADALDAIIALCEQTHAGKERAYTALSLIHELARGARQAPVAPPWPYGRAVLLSVEARVRLETAEGAEADRVLKASALWPDPVREPLILMRRGMETFVESFSRPLLGEVMNLVEARAGK